MVTLLWYNVKNMSKFIIFFSNQKVQNFKVIFAGNFSTSQKLPWTVPLEIDYVVKKNT